MLKIVEYGILAVTALTILWLIVSQMRASSGTAAVTGVAADDAAESGNAPLGSAPLGSAPLGSAKERKQA